MRFPARIFDILLSPDGSFPTEKSSFTGYLQFSTAILIPEHKRIRRCFDDTRVLHVLCLILYGLISHCADTCKQNDDTFAHFNFVSMCNLKRKRTRHHQGSSSLNTLAKLGVCLRTFGRFLHIGHGTVPARIGILWVRGLQWFKGGYDVFDKLENCVF